ncbi:MAG TPA: cell division protein FtsZ, partial [Spirochaetota bacterium]|nr:cell division protein FtsZ [Spirochaetota bacterium]
EKLTGGRGAGAIPDVGEKAALESEDLIRETLRGVNMLFVAAGMGGGTGTGAAPIIAKIAKEMGCLTVGVVTKPFDFEKRIKGKTAVEGINKLKDHTDTLIVISNQALFEGNDNISIVEAWRRADDVLKQGVQGISDLIVNPGEMNIDFADVQTVMKNRGQALMGVGTGRGDNAAIEAVTTAIENPLMPDLVVANAKALLVNVAGSSKMTLKQFSDVMKFIENIASDDALVIPGQSFDDTLQDAIKVTIVATGFEEKDRIVTKERVEEKVEPQTVEVKQNVYSHDEFVSLLKSSSRPTSKNIEEPAFLRKFNTVKKDKEEDENFLSKKS